MDKEEGKGKGPDHGIIIQVLGSNGRKSWR